MAEGSGDKRERTSSVRTEPGSMYDACSGPAQDVGVVDNSTERRSLRTEQAPEPRLPLSVGGAARLAAADLFNAVLAERWERGDDAVSNRVLADRYLRVDEKVVRQYRDGRKHVPLAALLVLPLPVVREVLDRLLATRGVTEREDAATLRQVIARMRERSPRDRAEVLRTVLEAQRQLVELAAELSR